MKKFIALALFVFFGNQTAFAKDIVLMLDLSNSDKREIYSRFVTKTGLHKKAADNYHVTVGWIQGVDPRDYGSLRQYMTRRLASYKKAASSFKLSHAGKYLIGGRTRYHCPIVLYPTSGSRAKLEDINMNLASDLRHYRSRTGKRYNFSNDLHPRDYTPHITIANSTYISHNHVQRDASRPCCINSPSA